MGARVLLWLHDIVFFFTGGAGLLIYKLPVPHFVDVSNSCLETPATIFIDTTVLHMRMKL
jgi:hypothetical protein